MKNIFFSLCILLSQSLQAQYYYNDILGAVETNRQMKVYQVNKVKTISATGYDKQGSKANNFSEFQEVKENGMALKISSFNGINKTVIYTRFDNQGRIINSTDSASGIQNTTTYEYAIDGKITGIKNTTKDLSNDFNQTETHQWLYNSSGKPEKMWRIITTGTPGTTDSLEIRFTVDEDGNTAEERTFRKGIETGYLYYYYDDKNRVSDIVRYNAKLKKLLPDFMFEYDDNDRVIQKITTTSSRNLGYLIWRYIFDTKGFKTKEALFNDDKELTGKIEYSYTFGQ